MATSQKINCRRIDIDGEDRLKKELESGLDAILGRQEIDGKNERDHGFKDPQGQIDRGVHNVVDVLGKQGTDRVEEVSAGRDQAGNVDVHIGGSRLQALQDALQGTCVDLEIARESHDTAYDLRDQRHQKDNDDEEKR